MNSILFSGNSLFGYLCPLSSSQSTSLSCSLVLLVSNKSYVLLLVEKPVLPSLRLVSQLLLSFHGQQMVIFPLVFSTHRNLVYNKVRTIFRLLYMKCINDMLLPMQKIQFLKINQAIHVSHRVIDYRGHGQTLGISWVGKGQNNPDPLHT